MKHRIIFILVLLWNTSIFASSQKPDIVFVHGAWGGGWDYIQLEQMLEAKGYNVRRVTLTGQGERSHLMSANINLDTHIMDVVNVLKYDDLSEVILVGHSYGGMVITGVAHRVPERIGHMVYMDAFLPFDGETAISFYPKERKEEFLASAVNSGNGISIPPFWDNWQDSKDVPHPLGTYLQPIRLGNPLADKLATTYVLTIDEGATTDRFSRFAERAKQKGWKTLEWRTGHNVQRTMPDKYVGLLTSIK